ncbi:hypothetical protein IJ380_03975, partial [Candidatus Saccharibacteria bacterium]|nr:hypothetical protein [Candidatus Saccharibacteria bacterium]
VIIKSNQWSNKMKTESTGYVMNGIGIIFSAIQTNEILSIISWAITILASVVSLAYTFYKWYKKAKADGKIDPDELEEGIEIAKDGIDDISKKIGDQKNGKN